jgi:DNA-directed RNA polymerase beta subunit
MQRVSYIEDDTQLMELVRHSILEADACMVKFLSKQAVVTGSATELVRNQKQALAYIGANVRDNVEPLESAGRKVLEYFLSHIGGGYTRKAFFLGYMVNQVLLAFLGRRPEDEKDHYMNKRLDLAGQLLQHQMRKVMFHFQHDTQKRVQKHLGKEEVLGPIKSLINDSIVTKGLQGAFTLGNWNTGAGLKNSGVVGDLKRMNPMATISQMRQTRVNLPPRSRPSDAARHP